MQQQTGFNRFIDSDCRNFLEIKYGRGTFDTVEEFREFVDEKFDYFVEKIKEGDIDGEYTRKINSLGEVAGLIEKEYEDYLDYVDF